MKQEGSFTEGLQLVDHTALASSVPGSLNSLFSSWKQAESAHLWKRAFSPRDKRWSEIWVVFSLF
jgi:hypothetical protein